MNDKEGRMKQYTDNCLKKLESLIDFVGCENAEQIKKWGVQTHTSFEWLTYLVEEVGELAAAISEHEYREGKAKEVFREAIQIAVLALKIAEMFKEQIINEAFNKIKDEKFWGEA